MKKVHWIYFIWDLLTVIVNINLKQLGFITNAVCNFGNFFNTCNILKKLKNI